MAWRLFIKFRNTGPGCQVTDAVVNMKVDQVVNPVRDQASD
jgi:hypothetical protein